MPQIPTYQRRATPQGTMGIQPVAPADVGRSTAVVGQALGQVARAQDDVNNADAEMRLREGRVWANKAYLTTQAEWQKQLTERSEKAPLGAPDFTTTLLKDYDEFAAERLKNAPTRDAREWLEARLGDFGNSLSQDALKFESDSRRTLRGNQLDEAEGTARTLLRAKPEQFDSVLADQLETIDIAGLGAAETEARKLRARQALSASAVETLVERDPTAALKALRAEPGKSGRSAVEGLSVESRERAINLAETEIRRREAEAKARAVENRQVLGDRLRDIATAASLGLPVSATPSRAELVAAFGEQDGAQRYAQAQQMVGLSRDIAGMHLLSNTELAAKVESYAPTQVEGAANQAALYGAAAGPAQRIIAAREKDPAGYLIQYSPLVAQKWEALQKGGSPTEYLSAVRAERERLGIPGSQTLPEGYVSALADRMATPGQESVAALMASESDRWGPAWPEVYKQVSKHLPDAALVIGSGIPKRAADALAQVSMLPKDQQDALLPAGKTRRDLSDEVESELEDLSATFGPEGAPVLTAVKNSVQQVALAYMSRGDSFGDAVAKAATDVANERYTFASFRGRDYRVPVQFDAGLVDDGATRALREFRAASGTVQQVPGTAEEVILSQLQDEVRRNGYWMTAPDESGLRLYVNGQMVPRNNRGDPVQFTWDELLGLGVELPTPPAGGPAPRGQMERR